MNSSIPSLQDSSDIAIIGLAGHFPGARNIHEFWQNLRNGVESISFFSDEELLAAGISSEVLRNPRYVKAKGVLDDVDLFDAVFFGYSPREAMLIDPQQRLFLECAWEALEHSGIDPEHSQGAIGVYAGVGISAYLLNNLYTNTELVSPAESYQMGLGNDKDQLTTRVSYKLNLRGPSVCIQTACSTSLVAVHLACQGLLGGECDIAMAGGVALSLPQKEGYIYQDQGIRSHDGHCRAFDARANGTLRGDGVGVVVLKMLTNALADGDYIHAVIKGSAINNDGASKIGYTAPSIDGQAKVIRAAQVVAGVDPTTIGYIEAHGTGTALGDPAEIAALTKAFRVSTSRTRFCAIGSVKTNIGHLDIAAGVAGLIKTILAIEHKVLPPSLHFECANPGMNIEDSPFYVNTLLSAWPVGDAPRRAGVSSFGIGGTNAHIILEEAPKLKPPAETNRTRYLLMLSAKTNVALEVVTDNLARHLKQNPDLDLADVAYTLQVGRKAFDYRRVLMCRDLKDAAVALETRNPQQLYTSNQIPHTCPVIFMFPGQGAQYIHMSAEIYQAELLFREQVDFCCELLTAELGFDLRDVLFPRPDQENTAAQRLAQTSITQPALFVIEYALAQLWRAWGVQPQALIGHSIGEYVAACLAGVFSLEDALTLVVKRGRFMQDLPGGAMLSVQISEMEIRTLSGQFSIAAANGPTQHVLAGTQEAIVNLEQQLVERGMASRRLQTSHAFHSSMIEPMVAQFQAVVEQVRLQPPAIPFISNVTGTWITEAQATDAGYWAAHVRETVRFGDGLATLLQESERILLEVGPGHTLCTLARQQAAGGVVVLPTLRHPQTPVSDMVVLLETLEKLWLVGTHIDWARFYAHERRQRVPLPTYPFEHQRYWIEPSKQVGFEPEPAVVLHKRPNIVDWFYAPVWKESLPLQVLRPARMMDNEGNWLVFVDGYGLGEQMVESLEQQGQRVTSVSIGQQFLRRSANSYTINPQQPGEYEALFDELQAADQLPRRVAHLWSITVSDRRWASKEEFEWAQISGFSSVLSLARALDRYKFTTPIQIEIISNNMQAVSCEDTFHPEKATLLALCKFLPKEYPNLTCRSTDIVLPKRGTWQVQHLIDQILAELTASPLENIVAYRERKRWIQTFEPLAADRSVDLRSGGVYLLTSGLTGMNFELAKHLAGSMHAKLVLLEHTMFPAHDEWQAWLATHDEQDHIRIKIHAAQILEELSAEIMVISTDLTDQDQVYRAVTQACEHFGSLHGVIYAPVEFDALETATQSLTQSEWKRHLEQRMRGLLALDQALHGQTLDFCLLQSSLSSAFCIDSQVEASAADLLMSAFAHQHNRTHSMSWMCVTWDSWKLATSAEVSPAFRGTTETLKITRDEGIVAFAYLLSLSSVTHVLVSTMDLQARLDDKPVGKVVSAQSDTAQFHPRSNLQVAYVAPTTELECSIAAIWEDLLGIKPIGLHDDFFELGGHSLLGTQLVTRLYETLQVKVALRDLFEFTTVARLSELIETLRWTGHSRTSALITMDEREEGEL